MLTRLMRNFPLRKKLLIVTVITLFNLLLIAVMVNMFFGTFRVLNMLTNGERIHLRYFQQGVSGFYQWKNQPESYDIDLAIQSIETANEMAFVFGKIDSLAINNNKESFERILFTVLNEAVHNDPANARLMANRSMIFIRMKDTRFQKATEAAHLGSLTGREIVSVMKQLQMESDAVLEEKLDNLIIKINEEYRLFAVALDEVGIYSQRLLNQLMVLIILLSAIFIYILSSRIAKSISQPMQLMVEKLEMMSGGQFVDKIPVTTADETGQMIVSFNKLQDNLTEIIQNTQQVAQGNYQIDLVPKSDHDQLSTALSKMTKALALNAEKQSNFDWLKTGKNNLSELLRGDLSLAELSKKTLSFFADYLPAEWGTFYIYDDDDKLLRLLGSFGVNPEGIQSVILPGQHLTGKCYEENKMIYLEKLEPGRVQISSSLLNISAHCLLITPLTHDGTTNGIIELASKQAFSDVARSLVEEVAEGITIAVKTSSTRVKLKTLLDKTQQQTEELQTQQEELKVANEELEEQTVALRENEKRLQEQQEELRVTNEELEERTQDLELQKKSITDKNLELETAQKNIELKAKQIEITSQYKSEFLANMSHELRTPLNSLLILSRDLAENRKLNLSKDQVDSASIIYQSGQDLLNLINEILDLSKIESGKMTITPEVVTLNELAQSARNNFKHMAEEKGLQFITKIDPELPQSVITDKHRLGQIIKNLVSNAIKFTHKGHILINFCSTHQLSFRNQHLNAQNSFMIAVEDSGIGIAIEKQQQVFEAFQQADGSISRKYGGTGLGLSITRELTRLLGGEIQLKSEPDKGSVFMIVLPNEIQQVNLTEETVFEEYPKSDIIDPVITEIIEKPKQIEIENISSEEEIFFLPDDRNNIGSSDKCLLIVEDDLKFAKTLLRQSRERGFKCIVAGSGEQALLLVEKYKPDAIILDIILPGMDGYKVLEVLKEDATTRHIPVHIMSATEVNLEAMQRGAIGFVSKPINSEVLELTYKKIEGYINKDIKDLLIVEDDNNMRTLIRKIIGGVDVKVTEVRNGKDALNLIQENNFDCMVLDLGLPDMTGFELLRKMQALDQKNIPPVIVYTGRDLTKEENTELHKYASSIIIKGVKSDERLLDETALFLHRIVDHLPESKKKMISILHDKESVFQNKNILLVDDDMRNIFALTRVLEERGMIITEAENGKVALEKLELHPEIDLILMDIMMPEMDGYTAIKEIRKQTKWEKLPIITLTAKAMKEDREKSLMAGANDYLTKPVDVSKLLSLLRVWLYK